MHAVGVQLHELSGQPDIYCKKIGFQTGQHKPSIAAYKSIRSVLSCLIRPAPFFCVRYRSVLPGLDAELFTILVEFVHFLSIPMIFTARLRAT